ncbi:MAG: hypothetical protein AAFX53_15575 [Bacteroidota bacterium]
MKFQRTLFVMISLVLLGSANAQESDDYLEFNDRKNVVHGVYLGITTHLGEIDGEPTYQGGVKVAYVANQQFEVGFAGNFLYSEQDIFNSTSGRDEDLIGGYGGLHLEPIFFSKRMVNLSFPLLIGAGAVGYVDERFRDDEYELREDDVDPVFVLEPGVSALFNISRYLQIEAGFKYRFSSEIDLENSPVSRINGFSGGLGIKIGIFNMGRHRYKKNI